MPHHDGLLHLLATRADGGDFHHIHPARRAWPLSEIALTPSQPGRYTAYVEIQRQWTAARR